MKFVFTSDWHIGLVTSDIDRTNEIVDVLKEIAKRTILESKKEKTVLILGGDLFDNNTPTEYQMGKLLDFFNYFHGKDIMIYVMAGNHETINNPANLSCLSFVRKLKKGYPYVRLIDNITCIHIDTFDNGPLYFSFFPHINKAHLHKTKEKSVQEYIENRTKAIYKKIGQGSQHYVFSHLNVREMIPNSDDNILRTSKVYLPDTLIMDTEPLDGGVKPVVIQGHFHSRYTLRNIEIIGSPIYTDFSDVDTNKYYVVGHIPEQMSKPFKLEEVEVQSCRRFHQVEINLVDHDGPIEDAIKLPKVGENDILKLSVTVDESNSAYDWETLRSKIQASTGAYVKPVNPKILTKRVKRNPEQTVNLKPEQAIKVWFRAYNHERRKERYKLAKEYLQ